MLSTAKAASSARVRLKTLIKAGSALATAMCAFTAPAMAGPLNLVTNGNFSANSTISVEQSETAAYDANNGSNNWSGQQAGTNAGASSVTGWTFGNANSFDFVIDLNTYGQATYSPAPQDTNGTVAYWDQPDGHYSAFNAILGALGNDQFAIASDPSHSNAAIQQMVSGLQVGDRYQLTFEQAATQQYGYSGAYTGAWQVSLGSQTLTGTTMSKGQSGYVPWSLVTLDFIATGNSELLSFLSTASAGANPPFLLLDDVSLADIPEPGEAGVLILAIAGMMVVQRKRARRHASTL